jgi:ABC-type nitrate/sulfonate/bicarbonate transport system substrate-binding protein
MFRRLALASSCGLLAAGVAACSSSAPPSTSSGSGSTQDSAPVQNVTVTAPLTENSYAIFIAMAEGFFKKENLNVKLIPSSNGGSDTVAVLQSGSADFAVQDSLVPTRAIAQGATIKYVLMPDTSASQQISIRKDAQGASAIENAGSPEAQVQALKGSNLKFGASSTASSSYTYLLTAARLFGLKIANPGDISVQTLGTPQNEIVAINSGRVDAVVGVPPTTTQKNTFQISLRTVKPFSEMAGNYLMTSDRFIHDNPVAVQAFVNAMVMGSEFTQKNKSKAEADIVAAITKADPTSDKATAQSDFEISYPLTQNPYPTQISYMSLSQLHSDQPQGPYPAYSKAVDPSFAKKAFQQLGLPVPTD